MPLVSGFGKPEAGIEAEPTFSSVDVFPSGFFAEPPPWTESVSEAPSELMGISAIGYDFDADPDPRSRVTGIAQPVRDGWTLAPDFFR